MIRTQVCLYVIILEYFDYNDAEKEIELTPDEKGIYGNREPLGYKKIKIVGKGGCGIVSICKCIKDGKDYAVKQISKKNKSEASIVDCTKEIEIISQLTDKRFNPTGLDYIIKLVEFYEDNQDLWLIFEKGGKSLGSLMFKIKGEFYNSERIYLIRKGRFFQHLFYKDQNFKEFFKKMLKMISLLSLENEIVHCDIKPDNVLLDYNAESNLEDPIDFSKMKLIDFGSAFRLEEPDNFSSNTPEYMPPEITELIERKSSSREIINFLKSLEKYPYAIDIWSLGVMMLEILLSCPIWMSYKTKTCINGKVSLIILIK